MFHTDVSLPKRPPKRSGIGKSQRFSPDESLSHSTRYLLHALRTRLTVVTAAAEMLDPVSTGPDSPAWTWGGTLRDEVVSMSQMLDSLEATLPADREHRHRVMLAQELTASTIRLFKKFGLTGRSASLPTDQDIAIDVRRPHVGTLFDMIWSAQVPSADSAKQMKLTITKENDTAVVRIVSPLGSHLTDDPVNQGALHCAQLIAQNLGVLVELRVEEDNENGRHIVSEVIFSAVEKDARGSKK